MFFMARLLVMLVLAVTAPIAAMDGCEKGGDYRCGSHCLFYTGSCRCGSDGASSLLGPEDVNSTVCCSPPGHRCAVTRRDWKGLVMAVDCPEGRPLALAEGGCPAPGRGSVRPCSYYGTDGERD